MSWAIISSTLPILAGLVSLLVYLFVKTPAQKEQADLDQLNEHNRLIDLAAKKAADEKDPSDLSKLINS